MSTLTFIDRLCLWTAVLVIPDDGTIVAVVFDVG